MSNMIGTVYLGQVRETPIGDLWLACSGRGLIAVEWNNKKSKLLKYLEKRLKTDVEENPRRLALVASELREYLDGKRKRFSIQIDWSGMPAFQRQVLLATYAVPYGQTTTYGDLAQQLGLLRSARAIGRAEATNPMPIVIPCHRVLGADGKLRGYGGGLEIKKWLLQLEGAVLA
jgi:methylated-DNA-[protein]-cysteine S-methyltransferase